MMETSSRGFVSRFLLELKAAGEDVLSISPKIRNPGDMRGLVWSGELPKHGRTASGRTYEAHGNGCRLISFDGRVVEFDFANDGAVKFDAWRVIIFIRSLAGSSEISQGDIQESCLELVSEGILSKVDRHWFRLS
ncbi:DUF6896 domain-containing protein [Kitasatospora sp. NPDC089509]|uniref:DUF6896 domain-containing protein n=1 Tax=Kitasatospora sp. NPDC089509 TaxID=3364079 RepID=UPI00382F081D